VPAPGLVPTERDNVHFGLLPFSHHTNKAGRRMLGGMEERESQPLPAFLAAPVGGPGGYEKPSQASSRSPALG
jgi:hypothetical protein